MTPKEEKYLILHALTVTEKKMQEVIATLGALRTKLSALPEILPTDMDEKERAHLIGAVSGAQKVAILDDIHGAIDAHADPMSAIFEAFDKSAKYAAILIKFGAEKTEE